MAEYLCGWIQDLSVYLILTAAVMHVIPGKDYVRYVRFFSGLVLILLLLTPALKLRGMSGRLDPLFEDAASFLEEADRADGWTETEETAAGYGASGAFAEGDSGEGRQEGEQQEGDRIRVEEVEIGH